MRSFFGFGGLRGEKEGATQLGTDTNLPSTTLVEVMYAGRVRVVSLRMSNKQEKNWMFTSGYTVYIHSQVVLGFENCHYHKPRKYPQNLIY